MKRNISAMTAVITCVGACAGTAAARTADSSKATQECSKVSPSSVSAIVGYKVPAATGTVIKEKASKKELRHLLSDPRLHLRIAEEPRCAQEIGLRVHRNTLPTADSFKLKKLTQQQLKTAGLKVSHNSGLGGTSLYMTASESGYPH